jgi:hypothetical protein
MAGMLPQRRSREELETANRVLIEQHQKQLSLWLAATFRIGNEASHLKTSQYARNREGMTTTSDKNSR